MALQAITAMVRQLRSSHACHGLVLANGGNLTYQHAMCLSTKPRADGTPYPDSRQPATANKMGIPEIDEIATGDAVIEVRYSQCFSGFRAYTF